MEQEVQRGPCTSCPHTGIDSRNFDIPNQTGMCVPGQEPISTHHYPPVFREGSPLGLHVCLDRCIMDNAMEPPVTVSNPCFRLASPPRMPSPCTVALSPIQKAFQGTANRANCQGTLSPTAHCTKLFSLN